MIIKENKNTNFLICLKNMISFEPIYISYYKFFLKLNISYISLNIYYILPI